MKHSTERSRKSRVRIIGPVGTPDHGAIQSFLYDCVISLLGDEVLFKWRTRQASPEVIDVDSTSRALREEGGLEGRRIP